MLLVLHIRLIPVEPRDDLVLLVVGRVGEGIDIGR